jgi:Protein of unknown function (DUF3035)
MRKLQMAMVATALLLAACGGSAGKLMGKSMPDETQVIDGPTLALPPQYELRPPREAADYETVLRAQKTVEAQELITGVSGTAVAPAIGAVPAGDDWLLKQTSQQVGVVADPGVREDLRVVTPEELQAREEAKAKKGLLGRWFGRTSDDE